MHRQATRFALGTVSIVVIALTGFRIAGQLSERNAQNVPSDISRRQPAAYDVPSTDRFKPQVVIPKRFPTITEFQVKSGAEVNEDINPSELVLGVALNGEARAYPINMLTGPRREIVNDKLGGTAIAATW